MGRENTENKEDNDATTLKLTKIDFRKKLLQFEKVMIQPKFATLAK